MSQRLGVKKELKKADDIMWRQLVYSGFASDSGHCGKKLAYVQIWGKTWKIL